MNSVIVRNYNEVVHKNDIVYIPGDICNYMKVEISTKNAAVETRVKVLEKTDR